MKRPQGENGRPWMPGHRTRRPFWSVATFSALMLLLIALFVNW